MGKGSPYDTAILGFLLLAVRGAFQFPPKETFVNRIFNIKEEAKNWPLLCHIDQSSDKINVCKTKEQISFHVRSLIQSSANITLSDSALNEV